MSVGVNEKGRANRAGLWSGRVEECLYVHLSLYLLVFMYLPLSPESDTEGHSSGEHVQLDQTTARLHRPPGPQSKFIPLTNNKQILCDSVTSLLCN